MHVQAIEGDCARESLAKTDLGRPADGPTELRRVRVEAPDVDPFFLGRPFDEPHRPRSGDLDEERDELPVADRLVAADVEDLAVAGVGGARPQERRGCIVYVDEIAKLRFIAEDLDVAVLDGQTDEPADEALAVVADELTRPVD